MSRAARALQVADRGLRDGEFLFAFLDDVYIATVADVGKTKVWNKAGLRPGVCDVLERAARERNPLALVLEGSRSASGGARHEDFGHPVKQVAE